MRGPSCILRADLSFSRKDGRCWAAAEQRVVATVSNFIDVKVGSSPIVTLQYSPTTLYQVCYHIQSLFF